MLWKEKYRTENTDSLTLLWSGFSLKSLPSHRFFAAC